MQENEQFNAMSTDVSNILSSSAEQTVSQGINVFSALIVIVIVLVIAFLVFKQGTSILTKPQVIIPIAVVIVALIGVRFL